MPASKAQQRAVAKYENAHYDKFLVRVPIGTKEAIQAHAKTLGLSLNGFVSYALNQAMNSATHTDISTDDINILTPTDSDSAYLPELPLESNIDISTDKVNCAFCGTPNSGFDNGWFACTQCERKNYEPTNDEPEQQTEPDTLTLTPAESSEAEALQMDTPADLPSWRCLHCGMVIQSKNKLKKFCSDRCRKANHKQKHKAQQKGSLE
jgi:endogenous inhibitor of DNA gyrase (YacG/DUF329 family)